MVRFYYIVGNFLKNKKLLTKLVETTEIAAGLFSTSFAFVFDYKCCRLYLYNFLSVQSTFALTIDSSTTHVTTHNKRQNKPHRQTKRASNSHNDPVSRGSKKVFGERT